MVDQNMLVYADAERLLAQLSESERAIALASGAPPPLTHDEYFALCAELFDAHHDAVNHTAHIQVSPAGGQWCSDALILRAVEFALARGTRVQMHMLETRFQRVYAEQTWGKSFIRHLDDIGALGPWLTLAHMVWVDPADLDVLAQRGVSVAHNPSSNLRLRSGIASFSALRRAGINVGIGLDGHGLDDDQDYLRELRLAWVLANMRDQLEAPAAEPLSAAAVLEAGSSNGARATLGDAPLGRLAPGNLADVVLIDLDAVPFDVLVGAAVLDVAAALLHLATRRHVRHVMVNGEWAVRDGRCTRVDERALERELRAQLRVAAQLRQTIRPAVVREFYAAWLEPPL
jgi:cytosine/adenosine deaminase-related metal-dependent hydrolase